MPACVCDVLLELKQECSDRITKSITGYIKLSLPSLIFNIFAFCSHVSLHYSPAFPLDYRVCLFVSLDNKLVWDVRKCFCRTLKSPYLQMWRCKQMKPVMKPTMRYTRVATWGSYGKTLSNFSILLPDPQLAGPPAPCCLLQGVHSERLQLRNHLQVPDQVPLWTWATGM